MKDGRPSDTAFLIARATVMLAQGSPVSHLITREAAGFCFAVLRHLAGDAAAERIAAGKTRGPARFFERVTLPGILDHYILRKAWIEQRVREAIGKGATEVIVIGAGYDTLAWRLHRERPEVNFVEIDHPATQGRKREVVRLMPHPPSGNLQFVSADLARTPLHSVVGGSGEKTVWVAEGLLMYLSEADVRRFFTSLRELRPGSEFVFTYMPLAGGEPNFIPKSRLINLWLRLKGEPMLWGIAPARLSDFLGELSFELLSAAAPPSPASRPARRSLSRGLRRLSCSRREQWK